MGSNVVLFGWNRSIPGRERLSAEHFTQFVAYLTGPQQKGSIQSFDTVFLDPHGGDLNGFFLIRGEPAKLDALMSTSEWVIHMTRALLHSEGSGAVRGLTGELIAGRMDLWSKLLPS